MYVWLPILHYSWSHCTLFNKAVCIASFLCSFSSSLDVPTNSNNLELPLLDVSLFQNLQAGHSKFKDAMTLFWKQNQAGMKGHMQASVKHLITCFLTSHMALRIHPSTNLFFKGFCRIFWRLDPLKNKFVLGWMRK